MTTWLRRCGECDEWWCPACETECPVCLVGAGVETGIAECGHCATRRCGECSLSYECVECRGDLCDECWHQGVSLCRTCWGEEGEEEPQPLELPPGFQIWEGEHRDFSRADPKEWRATWARHQKPKPWKEK